MALFLTDDLLKSDKKSEESLRGDSVSLDFCFRARQSNDQPGTATQGSRDSHELSRHCIEESRSLVNNSVSYGPIHRTSTDTDQGPIYVQRDTDREWTLPDGTTTSHSGQSIGALATLPASFGRPLRQVSRHADQPRGSGTTQREPSRGSDRPKRATNFYSEFVLHTSAVPAWNEAFQMLTHWVRQQPNGEVLYDATPPGTEARHIASRARGHTNVKGNGVVGRETPRNSESPTFSQVLFSFPSETVGAPRQRCA